MSRFRFNARTGTALKVVVGLFLAGMASSALATPVLYTFTGVIGSNSNPNIPDGTVQAFTYLSSAGFITSPQSLPLASLISCTGCDPSYPSYNDPVEITPGILYYDTVTFITYNNTSTLSATYYYLPMGAFSAVGTYTNPSGLETYPATLTVEAVPEPATVLLIAAPLVLVFWRRRRGPLAPSGSIV